MPLYQEDEMLMLSGIQHYMFCPRQWALIHVEQQWNENRLTMEGQLLHKNADDPFYRQKNGNCISLRSVSIASKNLGLYGFTDVVELQPSEIATNCITHPKHKGYWKPYPVEYKHGHAKPDKRDEVQLAAQVICLEEMHGIHIDRAFLYYGETNRREEVAMSQQLRQLTQQCADKMHSIFKTGTIPKAIKKQHCRSCSLVDICQPAIANKSSVRNYLNHNLYAETT